MKHSYLKIEMKYLQLIFSFFLLTINLAAQSSNEDFSIFIMGDTTFTNLCEGILFDSGGPDGNYQFREEHIFTICPTENTSCIAIEVVQYDIEKPF